MKKLALLALVSVLYAGEFDFGNGSFEMKGGFPGLENKQSTDIKAFTLAEEHKNLFGSKWFYKYELSMFQSTDLNTNLNSVNNLVSTRDLATDTANATNTAATDTTNNTDTTSTNTDTNNITSTNNSSNPLTYKYEAIDFNLALGRDVIHKDTQNYLGLGLLLGVSVPYIDTNSGDSNDQNTKLLLDGLKKSKTKIMTYKIGPVISLRKNFNKKIGVYSTLIYAYQTGSIKNKALDLDSNVDGNFMQYGLGIRFTPFMKKYKTKWITFTPKLYFTLGYRYSYWKVKDIQFSINNIPVTQKSDLEMSASILYAGIGYSF
jgi:hypothetical protein